MRLSIHCIALALLVLAGALFAQDQNTTLQSGPKVGELLPGPFDAYTVNGSNAGRQHCLVCEYALRPVVMVFAREPVAGKDGPFMSLLGQLDTAVARHSDDPALASFAVILSPDAFNSANSTEAKDAKKIVEETLAREALIERLKPRADKLKNVVLAVYPSEGPPKYQNNPKAEVSVIFYSKHKVLANFAFAEGKLAEADVSKIIKTVDDALPKPAE